MYILLHNLRYTRSYPRMAGWVPPWFPACSITARPHERNSAAGPGGQLIPAVRRRGPGRRIRAGSSCTDPRGRNACLETVWVRQVEFCVCTMLD